MKLIIRLEGKPIELTALLRDVARQVEEPSFVASYTPEELMEAASKVEALEDLLEGGHSLTCEILDGYPCDCRFGRPLSA